MQIRVFLYRRHIPNNLVVLQLSAIQRFPWLVVGCHINLAHVETRERIYPSPLLLNFPPAIIKSVSICMSPSRRVCQTRSFKYVAKLFLDSYLLQMNRGILIP